MCRITGFIDFNYHGQYDLKDTVIAMRETLIHGGPDDAGTFIDPENGLAFGHRRLSIIDLSPLGHQPYTFEHLTLCYNGEVYNFAEIKETLLGLGYTFQSHSDTEVIIKAYHCWGMACTERFHGMWAFAIWDAQAKSLFLCRDRVGVKPLFWYWKNGTFLFASELKALHKHPAFRPELNEQAMAEFLQHGYITAPDSIFLNTWKLLPGHWMVLNENKEIQQHRYWNLPEIALSAQKDKKEWLTRSTDDIRDELEGVLQKAFQLRMVADVPVGMFLSGGIDSSLVTAILQRNATAPLKTFTIGFDDKAFNEAHWAQKVARHLGTDHTELYCTPSDAQEILPMLPHIYDEPFGDSSAIPTLLVSRLARKQVTVSLSADGGDEQFYGYSVYPSLEQRWKKYGGKSGFKLMGACMEQVPPEWIQKFLGGYSNPYDTAADNFIRISAMLQTSNPLAFYNMIMKMIMPAEVKRLLLNPPPGLSADRLTKLQEGAIPGLTLPQMMMQADIRSYMPDDILVKVDRAGMSVALEGREPFLDHQLMAYAARMPDELKFREGKSKWILREVLRKYLPPEMIDRPKQGFAIPVNEWLRKDLKMFYEDYLSESSLKKEGIFDSKHIQKMKADYFKRDGMNGKKLWLILMFRMWKEKYMGNA